MTNSLKLHKILSELGLTDKESSVYLSSLALGPSSVQKIALHAGIKRTTVYSVLESLKLKGMVNEQITGFKVSFVASPPASLRSLMVSRLSVLEEVMPELSALYNLPAGEGLIKHYEGLDAVKALYEDVLASVKAGQDYLVLTDLFRWQHLDGKFFGEFASRRDRKLVKLRVLSVYSSFAAKKLKNEVYIDRLRMLPVDMNVTTNLIITPQCVVFHQLEAPIEAIMLNNRSVVHLHREMFEVIWATSHLKQ
jgi:HTH-type transcriptional regulator, sugar sensing transcriptional regulator